MICCNISRFAPNRIAQSIPPLSLIYAALLQKQSGQTSNFHFMNPPIRTIFRGIRYPQVIYEAGGSQIFPTTYTLFIQRG